MIQTRGHLFSAVTPQQLSFFRSNAVLSHGWEPTHGGEWATGLDEVLLPNLPVRAPNGAI